MSSKRCNVIERDIEKTEAEMEKVPVRLQVDYFSGKFLLPYHPLLHLGAGCNYPSLYYLLQQFQLSKL